MSHDERKFDTKAYLEAVKKMRDTYYQEPHEPLPPKPTESEAPHSLGHEYEPKVDATTAAIYGSELAGDALHCRHCGKPYRECRTPATSKSENAPHPTARTEQLESIVRELADALDSASTKIWEHHEIGHCARMAKGFGSCKLCSTAMFEAMRDLIRRSRELQDAKQ